MKERRGSNVKEERRTEEEEEKQWRGVVKAAGFGLDLPSAKGMTDWILLACIFEQRRRTLRHLSAHL